MPLGILTSFAAGAVAFAGMAPLQARDLTVRPPVVIAPAPDLPSLPTPSPFGTDGPPQPLTNVIVDGRTRFLVAGAAQARCPDDRVVFFSGVVNAFRPTLPGDGAFMCRSDAIAEGFMGP